MRNKELQPIVGGAIAGGDITGGDRREPRPRAELVAEWRKAPEELLKYPAGSVTDPQGNILYTYSRGTRLIILDQEVMDTCQLPWARATVNRAFAALGGKEDVKVLERGFGMGLVATAVILDHLSIRGGEYTCIELNEEDANYADTTWRKEQNEELQRRVKARVRSIRGRIGQTTEEPTVIINDVLRGDAFEETAKLAATGVKFDLIISDTFPLSEEERSVNDLLDLGQLVQCLNPEGVFAFFGFHTGSEGTMNSRQRNIIDTYFVNVSTTYVRVYPPKEYKYFNPASGPVMSLPVIICTKPRQIVVPSC